MTEFVAEAPDLSVELTVLDGTKIVLVPEEIVNSKRAKLLMDKWVELEKKEGKNKISPIEILSKELAFVYDKSSEWFEENLDVGTLQEIVEHVARCLGGAKKKEKN